MTYTNDLISIIVPVYNVVNYLDQCILSILEQTYTNLEIILIDDGSTDGSGDLCDVYANMDQRIISIHKKNGGLSDARNTGLEIAKGEWIGFVDSDDYIDKNMYEYLYQLCMEYDVKLSCARYDECGEINKQNVPKSTGVIKRMSGEEMLEKIYGVNDKDFATVSVWDRLYHWSVLNGLRFPVGSCYEDIVFSTKAILEAKECVYINESLYHYRIRTGSITKGDGDGTYDRKLITDRLPLQHEHLGYLIKSKYYDLANLVKAMYYQDMLYCKGINTYVEYQDLIDETLENWRLKIKEIYHLNIAKRKKFILYTKMYFPFIWEWYYRRKQYK